ncbi:hypothetical protein [Mucilaginibacter aquariorum]|uniref:Uncharacterized protein n=1 Tax=Mucilaginibacter aquariorum TaxID=2967225 RepID=A0ABT1SYQ2_9SPHI|nr:hypothetical protein [Mucilaginibacter aquariorum]MCQ6957449.1 hypothetical protein [Mucilaginibacter aquariorum]
MLSLLLLIGRSPPRRLLLFLDRKEAKDQVGKKASLPHKAFALQTRQNHGLESFALLRSLIAPPFSKISYAPATHRPPSFCPLSPEAVLPTGEDEKKILLIS